MYTAYGARVAGENTSSRGLRSRRIRYRFPRGISCTCNNTRVCTCLHTPRVRIRLYVLGWFTYTGAGVFFFQKFKTSILLFFFLSDKLKRIPCKTGLDNSSPCRDGVGTWPRGLVFRFFSVILKTDTSTCEKKLWIMNFTYTYIYVVFV